MDLPSGRKHNLFNVALENMEFAMKQARVLTEQEQRRLLAVIADTRYAARNRIAFMLSYMGGLRVGEIASLKVKDVLDGNGAVREQVRLSAEVTKGGHARTVFVSEKLRRELERYASTLDEWRRQTERPLLLTQKGKAFTPNVLCQFMGKIYQQAGFDGATSHSGRRWFITKLAHSGISAKVIMTLAGHKHLTTTQRYIDVNDEMMRHAVAVL